MTKNANFIIACLLTVLFSGCTSFPVEVSPSTKNITVEDYSPGPQYKQIGAIFAKHGWGCGLYGSEGNFEGAYNILINKAAQKNADFVKIVSQQGEHMSGACLDRAYTIEGIAYKLLDK